MSEEEEDDSPLREGVSITRNSKQNNIKVHMMREPGETAEAFRQRVLDQYDWAVREFGPQSRRHPGR